jgi:hypothetical protein
VELGSFHLPLCSVAGDKEGVKLPGAVDFDTAAYSINGSAAVDFDTAAYSINGSAAVDFDTAAYSINGSAAVDFDTAAYSINGSAAVDFDTAAYSINGSAAERSHEIDLIGRSGAVGAAGVAQPGHGDVEIADNALCLDAHAIVELHRAGGMGVFDQS